MGRGRFFVTPLLINLVGVFVTACSDDADESSAWSGTCDMRSAAGAARTCTEWKSAARDETGIESSCVEQGGVWSNEPCPGAGQVGDCSFESESESRACFYYDADLDAVAVCMRVCAP